MGTSTLPIYGASHAKKCRDAAYTLEDVQTLKLAYGLKETFNNEFRAVVQEENKDSNRRIQEMAIHFAGIDGKLKILLWVFGLLSAGIIGLVVIVVTGLLG